MATVPAAESRPERSTIKLKDGVNKKQFLGWLKPQLGAHSVVTHNWKPQFLNGFAGRSCPRFAPNTGDSCYPKESLVPVEDLLRQHRDVDSIDKDLVGINHEISSQFVARISYLRSH